MQKTDSRIRVIAAATHDVATPEAVKALIPDPLMRRRMGKLTRAATATALSALRTAGAAPDAIFTATGYGFLEDSEKFLRSTITAAPPQPTPFIQSTFNTVASYLAIITGNHSQNLTFVNGHRAFADALIAAAAQFKLGTAERVLLVAFDEVPPTLLEVMRNLGLPAEKSPQTVSLALFLQKETIFNKHFPSSIRISDLMRLANRPPAPEEVLCPTLRAFGIMRELAGDTVSGR